GMISPALSSIGDKASVAMDTIRSGQAALAEARVEQFSCAGPARENCPYVACPSPYLCNSGCKFDLAKA
ncbi:hypothetical protein ABTO31_18665, partial [Acinetobacter baumannii]